uniref:Uncharacterized protein ycf23 n=1 Tax=Polysiphonia sp. TaxID=1967842 RepID=A0A1Z1MTL0_9FLOR|nr:hypothetical protein [Polysiphonia sp.]
MKLHDINLYNSFQERRVVKIIAGIDNTNVADIIKIAKAAELSNASYLDVVANVRIVKVLKSFSTLPICISSINPLDIYNCLSSGADLVEVGNYDAFYNQNIFFNTVDILNLTKEIKLIIDNKDICVTIPYYLNLDQQINLACRLEELGVNILQTEGCFFNSKFKRDKGILQNFSSSLLSTYSISKAVNIPVITSSGVNSMLSCMSTYYGSSGVGIGSVIRNKSSLIDMVNYINEVKELMNNHELQHNNLSTFDNFVALNKF